MRSAGGIRSANADMSSEKGARNPLAASPRFPQSSLSSEGQSAPKARQRCVADGKQVNIPVPMCSAMWGRRRLAQPTVGIVGSSL